jgi:hypothetical protein
MKSLKAIIVRHWIVALICALALGIAAISELVEFAVKANRPVVETPVRNLELAPRPTTE